MTELSDADLVQRYIDLRTKKAELEAAHKEHVGKYTAAMDLIEGVVNARMIAAGHTSIKTEAGTAFKSTLTKYKVRDRESFAGYVIENRAWNMVDWAVDKEATTEFCAQNEGVPPPGVEVTQIVDVKFRKA